VLTPQINFPTTAVGQQYAFAASQINSEKVVKSGRVDDERN